jgi:hypothetical protein
MARLVTTIQRFIGTAVERAALDTTNINPGSTYFEDDTGLIYALNTDTPKTWIVKKDSVELTGSDVIQGAVQNVTTAGTRVQLPDIACKEITIIAKRANTGYIYIGGDDVSDAVYGVELESKDSITLAVGNANLIYIDASVSGEGISYVTL